MSAFEAGERVMLVDQRDRTYLMTLQTGGTYHTHSGTLPHDDLLGKPEGTRVETSKGTKDVGPRAACRAHAFASSRRNSSAPYAGRRRLRVA